MIWEDVKNSSNLGRVGYDAEKQLLTIEFSNGSGYVYEDVTPEKWQQMQNSARDPESSTGKLFASLIKGQHSFRKV
jgi:KTSC domain